MHPWFTYQGPRWNGRDSEIRLHWSPSGGWWAEGAQTGRKTKPMPRILGATLCGILIWQYPEILRLVLAHAENTGRYVLVYSILSGVTLVLAGLVGFYMWLGFKSGPSGLEYMMRQFGKVFGKDREDDETPRSDTTDTSASLPSKND